MAEAGFWDNPEKAKKTIQQVKSLNAVVKPYEELAKSRDDFAAMMELAEEDAGFEAELEGELGKAMKKLEEFELKAMMSGGQDRANAIVSIKPGAGGTDACDWAEILYRMYTRWATAHGFTVEETDKEPNMEAGLQSVEFKVSGEYAYGYMQSDCLLYTSPSPRD